MVSRKILFSTIFCQVLLFLVHCEDDVEAGTVTQSPEAVGEDNETTISPVGQVFSPSVSATCRAGIMTIRVETGQRFLGAVHARDYRRSACTAYGLGNTVTELNINMLADENSDNFCGVFINQKSEERSVAIAVRMHRTLELADDKFYMITCGKAGFQNTHNQTSLVTLELLRDGKKVQQVVYGREYMLRAHISKPDGAFGMRVKRCFSFSDQNSTVELVNENGCPEQTIMGQFKYDRLSGTADAVLYSMFKFPDSNRVHFQCDIVICKGNCAETKCDSPELNNLIPQGRSLAEPKADAFVQQPDDGALMASFSVFVVDPGTLPVEADLLCEKCGLYPAWVLYLCITFGAFFILMLIINLFMCSSLSCSFVTPMKVEKEASYLEDYDPYARSLNGSQYGSRYSLNGGIKTVPVPYLPADTARSVSSTSEYGGHPAPTVTSRPNSRHSQHRSRGPPSTSGSNSGYSRQSSKHLVAK